MSRAKDKGTRAETAVVRYERALLGERGEAIERMPLNGAHDMGDVKGLMVCGSRCVQQVKDHRVPRLGEWMDDVAEQAANAGAEWGVLIAKPNGVGHTRAGEWLAVMGWDEWSRMAGRLMCRDSVLVETQASRAYREHLLGWVRGARRDAAATGHEHFVVRHPRTSRGSGPLWYATTTLEDFLRMTQGLS